MRMIIHQERLSMDVGVLFGRHCEHCRWWLLRLGNKRKACGLSLYSARLALSLPLVMDRLILVTTEFAAVAHLMMSVVLFYFARRSVSFLAQAWVMLIFCLMYGGAMLYVAVAPVPALGVLHPVLLVYLLACSFLQSIYPLGLCMPGYLQWGRMWGYALPAIALICVYAVGVVLGSNFTQIFSGEDVRRYFLSGDVLLRLAALLLSGYYIINIFRLPHRLVRKMEIPRYLTVYGTLLGGITILFLVITIRFSFALLIVYILLFTVVNLFLSFRIIRPVIERIQWPDFHRVEKRPTSAEVSESEREDFNAANLRRFEVMEYLMQHEKPFVDCLFNRDKLCRLSGFNRHLVLQSLRSQGYNDIHEYINRYRVAEMKRMLMEGEMTDLKQFERVGFRAQKTAEVNFERYENCSLQEWYKALLAMREKAQVR